MSEPIKLWKLSGNAAPTLLPIDEPSVEEVIEWLGGVEAVANAVLSSYDVEWESNRRSWFPEDFEMFYAEIARKLQKCSDDL